MIDGRSGHRQAGLAISQEKKLYEHMENAEGAKLSFSPLLFVIFESGMKTVGEFANNWNGPFITWQRAFFGSINGLLEEEEGEQDGYRGDGDRRAITQL